MSLVKARTLAESSSETIDVLPCAKCGRQTQHATLANYGARCFQCYEDYLKATPDEVQLADKSQDPKGWAKLLRKRELMGERIGQVRRSMWRSVLGDSSNEPTQDQTRSREDEQARQAKSVADYAAKHGIKLTKEAA